MTTRTLYVPIPPTHLTVPGEIAQLQESGFTRLHAVDQGDGPRVYLLPLEVAGAMFEPPFGLAAVTLTVDEAEWRQWRHVVRINEVVEYEGYAVPLARIRELAPAISAYA